MAGSFLTNLRLGLGGSAEDVDSVGSGGYDLTTTELSVLYLHSDAGPAFDGMRTRIVPQISWPIGPFAFRGEYLLRKDELAPSAAPDDELETSGFYVQASFILTGEDKKPEDRIVPKGSMGAVELAIRYAHVELDDPFATGANIALAAGNTDKVDAISFAVNWWFTRNVRLTASVIHETYDDEIDFDNGTTDDSMTGFLFRAQVDF
jgi:phosphate-selective porin